jgi:uncharacterized membrane protein
MKANQFQEPALQRTDKGARGAAHTGRNPLPLVLDFVLIGLIGAWLLIFIYAGEQGDLFAFAPIRLVLGLIFILFVPGYTVQAALFPKKDDLGSVERAGISTGISLGFIPLIALILDRLPWGLSLWPIFISEALTILIFSGIALVRRWCLPLNDCYLPGLSFHAATWWTKQNRIVRQSVFFLALAMVIAFGSAAAIIFLPKPDERFTEFSILGPDKLAESYPREATAGQSLSTQVSIHNLEGREVVYKVLVSDEKGGIGHSEEIRLDNDATFTAPLSFTPQQIGDDVPVVFSLYREGVAQPYRTLKLILKVKPAP